MASELPEHDWRSKLEVHRDRDREQIDGALASGKAFWIVAAVVVIALAWAVISTFL